MKLNYRSIAQKLRWLNKKAVENEWTENDLVVYLDDLGLWYDVVDDRADWVLAEVYSKEDFSKSWYVQIVREWSEEDDEYWDKELEKDLYNMELYDQEISERKIIEVDVEKV